MEKGENMVLKTFNIDKEVYEKYSRHCKKNGISMSRQVENFLRSEIEKISGKKKTEVNNKFLDVKIDEHPLKKYC